MKVAMLSFEILNYFDMTRKRWFATAQQSRPPDNQLGFLFGTGFVQCLVSFTTHLSGDAHTGRSALQFFVPELKRFYLPQEHNPNTRDVFLGSSLRDWTHTTWQFYETGILTFEWEIWVFCGRFLDPRTRKEQTTRAKRHQSNPSQSDELFQTEILEFILFFFFRWHQQHR